MTSASKFIDPEEVEVQGEKFILSKIPAYTSQDIFLSATQAFQTKDMSQLPQDVVSRLMSYVAKKMGDGSVNDAVCLDCENAINAYCKDVFMLMELEVRMVEKNYGFLFDGRLQSLLERMNVSTKSIGM